MNQWIELFGQWGEHQSIIELLKEANPVVQLVLLVLMLASLTSWSIILHKWLRLRSLDHKANLFEDDFWSGLDVRKLFEHWSKAGAGSEGMASLFISGYDEYRRLVNKERSRDLVDAVHRAMRVALAREVDLLETNLSFLATVASTGPYIGLFGTVWGIMDAFQAISASGNAAITTVAPGIAEALIGTAAGLFVAIPAVIGYNRFSDRANKIATRYDIFIEEFLSLVNRQTYRGSLPNQSS